MPDTTRPFPDGYHMYIFHLYTLVYRFPEFKIDLDMIDLWQ